MGYVYSIMCDGCKLAEPGWNTIPQFWVTVHRGMDGSDDLAFCPECWAAMARVLNEKAAKNGK